MPVVLHPGDCLEVIPRLVAEGVRVDAVVCDPPYGLEFMGKEWDKFRTNSGSQWSQKRATGKDWKGQERERPGRLYMRSSHKTCRTCGKQSHQHNDAACTAADYELVTHEPLQMRSFQEWCESWGRAALSILRPGGFLVAFGGTRTYHRMVCGLEDAGLVIQDQIAWLYGTGFPKHRSHLKPSHEPIVLAYKPGGKRTMQVDECRIETEGRPLRVLDAKETEANVYSGRERGDASFSGGSKAVGSTDLGRWPANICLEDCEEVVACFPQSAGQQGDVRGTEPSQTGESGIYGKFGRVPFNKRSGEASAERRYTEEGASDFAMLPGARRSDGGSAARFFFSAKAGADDRFGSRHPTVKPVELMKWLVALVTPTGGTCLDPFAGSGTTGVAALAAGRNAILIEREATYCDDIRARLAFYEGGGQHSVAAKARSAVPRGTLPLFE